MKPLRLLASWCMSLIWKLMPNCAEMSRLSSQQLDKPLPLRLRLRMFLHSLVCSWCRRYRNQLRFIHRAAPLLHDRNLDSPLPGLSPIARQRIVQRLRDENSN